MGKYLEIFTSGGVLVYIIIAIIFLFFAGGVFWTIKKSKYSGEKQPDSGKRIFKAKPEKEIKIAPRIVEEKTEESGKSILGTGTYKCMCFCPGNILDYTTIPKPIGDIYQLDPSNPLSGAAYIVMQKENGEVVDYDPREVPVDIKTSPELAYFAIRWDIVKTVFNVLLQWWKSTSTWFAVGMMAITFICALVVLD